jgi:hypothetical protein
VTAPVLFDGIRAACAEVAIRAGQVSIDHARIPAYAANLPRDLANTATYDDVRHFRGDPEATAAYLLTLDTVNFGSGWFPVLAKRPGMSGYYTIATSLTDRYRQTGPIPASALTRMTPSECAYLFGQDPDGPAMDLMARFSTALNDLGEWIETTHRGSFLAPVEAASGSAETLCETIAEAVPGFRDVARHGDLDVPLMKRAQLLCADLALAFEGHGPGAFDDLARMTIFADNLVPHVLRMDGLLRYDPDLAAKIEREELIPAGSPEETEIRAVGLHCCELILAELSALGRPATAAHLDFLLWNRGQSPAIKAQPRHRARSIFY